METPHDLKRAANAVLRTCADGPCAELPYVCECEDAGCLRAVWLTAAEYDRHRADPHQRRLAAHEPAEVASRAYATSR